MRKWWSTHENLGCPILWQTQVEGSSLALGRFHPFDRAMNAVKPLILHFKASLPIHLGMSKMDSNNTWKLRTTSCWVCSCLCWLDLSYCRKDLTLRHTLWRIMVCLCRRRPLFIFSPVCRKCLVGLLCIVELNSLCGNHDDSCKPCLATQRA